MVVPSKEEQALRRLRRLEKALRAEQDGKRRGNGNGRHDSNNDSGSGSGKKDTSHSSFLVTLAGHAVTLLKPVLSTAVAAALNSHGFQPQPPPATDPNASTATNDGGSTTSGIS